MVESYRFDKNQLSEMKKEKQIFFKFNKIINIRKKFSRKDSVFQNNNFLT